MERDTWIKQNGRMKDTGNFPSLNVDCSGLKDDELAQLALFVGKKVSF